MKFTNHQKKIIRAILNGEVFDIYTYLKHFDLGKIVKYDKNDVLNKFKNDQIPKIYYRENGLQYKAANTLTEQDYLQKLKNQEISPDDYTRVELNLSYSCGIRTEVWNGLNFNIDFYDGVYVAKSFYDVLEFLTLWQYLKSEMLILEVPKEMDKETLGLFYEKQCNCIINDIPLNERIDYKTLTYDDRYYLTDENYSLSTEHCYAYKDYFDKKIYPSPKLSIFINKNFKTADERAQSKNLFVAWVAIFISVLISIVSYFSEKYDVDSKIIISELKSIKTTIKSNDFDNEICEKIDVLINKINTK